MIPEWLRLRVEDTGEPIVVNVDPRALDLVRRTRPSVRIVPLVQNYHDEDWDAALMARRIATPEARTALVNALTEYVERNGFGGVVIDFEDVPDEADANLRAFLSELHASFAPHGWAVGEAVPFADDTWDYAAHAAVTDYLFLMAYDQHYAKSDAGPVAGQDWYEHALAARLAVLAPAKVVVCIGGYGYDWAAGASEASVISFYEAVLAARGGHAERSGSIRSRRAIRN